MKHKKMKSILNRRLLYSILVAIVLSAVCLTSIFMVYNNSIEENYEQLHLQTKQFKKDIKLQMESDHENLITMSRFAEKLYENGEDYDLLYKSFKEIGLLSEIGILLPDGTFITKVGETDVKTSVSFEEEAVKGAYISGKVADFTNKDKYIIRSSAPVKHNDETIAILYGMTELEDLHERYAEDIESIDAHLYVFEADSGELIIDTVNPTLDNISILENRTYRNGYTYSEMIENINMRYSGYTEFVSRMTQEDLYVHYSPLGISDWYIMLARPTQIVFRNAHRIAAILVSMFLILLGIMLIYLLLVLKSERNRTGLNNCAASVRKLLLEINHENSSIEGALREVADYAKARSVIFADTDGQLFKYSGMKKVKHFTVDEQKYFVSKMLEFSREHNSNNGSADIKSYEIKVSKKGNHSEFDDFMLKNKINSVIFTVIVDRSGHIGMVSVLNSKNGNMAKALLEKIGVCFSIAIYNRKHLMRTEVAALTDSLTGLSNRAAYKQDVKDYEEKQPNNFACIYVDVNELHIFNSKNGHAAGDSMLVYIANTLKEVFFGHSIYRMGGDEFLVFATNVSEQTVIESIEAAKEKVEAMKYHISVGYSYEKVLTDIESMLSDAEVKMYNDKALYYQNKELAVTQKDNARDVTHVKTGIRELDKSLEIMSQRYSGIYSVNLDSDKARRILMPAYLGYNENEDSFTGIFTKYVNEAVNPDFHRAMMSFLNYEAIRKQIMEDKVPRITYSKINGENIVLSVYRLDTNSNDFNNTLWIFENI